jgi:hypothetical protein
MKQKLIVGFCSLLLLASCGGSISEVPTSEIDISQTEINDFEITPINNVFDFDTLNDLEFQFDNSMYNISFLSGHNIIASDYEISSNVIKIKKHYLVYLTPGNYELNVHATNGKSKLGFEIQDKNNQYRVINHSFETGDLFGWEANTIFKGERNLLAFTNDNVILSGDALSEPFTNHGNYLLGPPVGENKAIYEEKMGTLISSTFTLAGSGFITFNFGVGRVADLSYLSFHRESDNYEIARYSAYKYHDLQSSSRFGYATQYRADLTDYLGERLYAVITDLGGHEDDYITFDALHTYYESMPEGTNIYPALNEVPAFALEFAPNEIPNGDFSQGLEMWSVSEHLGWQDTSTFHIEEGILKSNATGDEGRGLIRSSLFKIEGSGFASIKIGAAKGARFDKDTFVSIRLQGSNKEIFRLANERHDGTNMIEYFIDLSDYINEVAYFEIIDNATNSWDTIFVSNIKTYYEELPDLTTANHARNLVY